MGQTMGRPPGYRSWSGNSDRDHGRWHGRGLDLSAGCGQDQDPDPAEPGYSQAGVVPSQGDINETAFVPLLLLLFIKSFHSAYSFATYFDFVSVNRDGQAWRCHTRHVVCDHRSQTHLQDRRRLGLVPWSRAARLVDQRPEWDNAGVVSISTEKARVTSKLEGLEPAIRTLRMQQRNSRSATGLGGGSCILT